MNEIHVAICDDMAEICNYYQSVISCSNSLIFDGSSTSCQGCLELVANKKPDILLLDMQIEEYNSGIKLIDECKEIKDRQQSLLYIFTNLIHLSNLEFEILMHYCMGYSYKQLSEKYFVEDTTVRSHMSRIMKKLGFSSSSAMKDALNNLKVFELFNPN